MSMKTITVRMDDGLKKNADALFAELGMNFSTALNIFVRQAVREQRIPFEVSVDPFYSAGNIAELEKRIANIRSGKSTLKEHDLIETD